MSAGGRVVIALFALGAGCTLVRDVDGISGGHCRTDGVKNGVETDVDCGNGCGPCAEGRACLKNTDCASGICSDTRDSRTCIRKCAENDVSPFACSPPCSDRDVCLKHANGAPACAPLLAGCSRDQLADCTNAYCGHDSIGGAATEGQLQCFESCP